MTCNKCGANNQPTAKFCVICGNALQVNSFDNYEELGQTNANINLEAINKETVTPTQRVVVNNTQPTNENVIQSRSTQATVNNEQSEPVRRVVVNSTQPTTVSNSYSEPVRRVVVNNAEATNQDVTTFRTTQNSDVRPVGQEQFSQPVSNVAPQAQPVNMTEAVNSVRSESNNNSNFNLINFLKNMIIKPYSTIDNEISELESTNNTLKVVSFTSIFALIAVIITTIFGAAKTSSYFSGDKWDFSNLQYVGWIDVLIEFLIMMAIIIIGIAATIYIVGMLFKKNSNFVQLIGIAAAIVVPFVLLNLGISPILSVLTSGLGNVLKYIRTVGFVYSLILLALAINKIFSIEKGDKKVYFFSLILLISGCILMRYFSISSTISSLFDSLY